MRPCIRAAQTRMPANDMVRPMQVVVVRGLVKELLGPHHGSFLSGTVRFGVFFALFRATLSAIATACF